MRNSPQRPFITPVFSGACLLWAGCAVAYSRGAFLDANACAEYARALSCASCALMIAGMLTRRLPLAVAITCVSLGAALGCAQAAVVHAQALEVNHGTIRNAIATIESDSRIRGEGETALASVALDNGVRIRAYVDFGDVDPLMNGEQIVLSGSAQPIDATSDDYLWNSGIAVRFRVASCEKLDDDSMLKSLRSVRKAAVNAIGSDDDAHALLQALVCGWRHDIVSTSIYARFQACGLAHLVAVSGAHLVIVTSLIATLLRAFKLGRRISVAVLVSTMISYLVLSGVPVSAVRAALMSSVGLLAIFGRRRPSAQNALGIGILSIVLSSPSMAVSASFVLSALSTAGIVMFAPLISSLLQMVFNGRMTFVTDALSMTLAASMMSQPYACSLFGILPILSPLANVACAPVFPLACALGMMYAIASLAAFPGAPILLFAASAVSSVLARITSAIGLLPYAAIPVSVPIEAAIAASLIASFLVYIAWNRLTVRCIVACLLCAIFAFAGTAYVSGYQDALIMLDVGQGDAFLFRSKGHTLLVDTGNQDAQLLEQLATCSVMHIDSVLLTHSDDDHVGSLDALQKAVGVDRVIVFRGIEQSTSEKNIQLMKQAHETAREVVSVDYGNSFEVGSFRATVVWPKSLTDDGANADSICLLVEYDGNADGLDDFRILMTGDAESSELMEIVRSGAVGDIDILKVGHHGSRNGMNRDLSLLLKPEIALIGVGAGNRYGHPSPETIDTLESIGCQVFRTDEDGCVRCLFDSDAIHVEIQ